MNKPTDVFVDHFASALGDLRTSIDETAKEGKFFSDVALLKEAGFSEHCRSKPTTSSYDLAKSAVEKIRPQLKNIGAILYAHCLPLNANIGKYSEFERTRDVKYIMDFPVSHLQADFGLEDAFVVGLSQQACTGMLFAIRTARSLLISEPELDQILCLTADRFPEGAAYEQAYNVISDGAAACIVSRKPAGFRYIAGHAITNGALARASDDETVGSYFNYTHRLIQELLGRAKLEMKDISWIVPQNMNKKAWEILASIFSFDKERICFSTLPKVGHMISGDNVVNLQSLIQEDRIKSGEKILVPMAGFGLNWQGLILEKV